MNTMALNPNLMDFVHENSVNVIEVLQKRFEHQSGFFFLISNLFDPRYAFLVFFPLLFSLSRELGTRALWVTIIAEWSNQVLKWLLHGERPYWWIHETPVYNRTGVAQPDIQQYFMTCETGPGSPSGHVMVTAALWYVLFSSVMEHLIPGKHKNGVLSSLFWTIYGAILVAVSLSRVYIAAHFPHQCMLGVGIGVLVAMAVSQTLETMPSLPRLRHYVLATVGLLGSALLTYGGIKALGLDPMWSVSRALKWCAKQEYIHLDTTPFFSMMRYGGFTLGMGLGISSGLHRAAYSRTPSTGQRVGCVVLALALCKLSEYIVLPKENLTLFYGLAFFINTVIPFLVTAVIPFIVAHASPSTTKSKSQ